MTTREELLAAWREAREAFKLDGKQLTPEETAGMIIESVGGVEPALRLMLSHRDTPMFIELARPKITDPNGLVNLLTEAWWAEKLELPDAPTREWLVDLWQLADSATLNLPDEPDPMIHAAAIVARHDNLAEFVHRMGLALYSPLHEVGGGIAAHPATADILFLVDMVRWRDEQLAKAGT